MNHRIEQVASTLQRALSDVITKQLNDPRLQCLIHVTRINVTVDLQQAMVYVSVLPKEKEGRALHALNAGTRHIHKLVCKKVSMRKVPYFEFRTDKTVQKELDVLEAIRNGMECEAESEAKYGKNPAEDAAMDTNESNANANDVKPKESCDGLEANSQEETIQ